MERKKNLCACVSSFLIHRDNGGCWSSVSAQEMRIVLQKNLTMNHFCPLKTATRTSARTDLGGARTPQSPNSNLRSSCSTITTTTIIIIIRLSKVKRLRRWRPMSGFGATSWRPSMEAHLNLCYWRRRRRRQRRQRLQMSAWSAEHNCSSKNLFWNLSLNLSPLSALNCDEERTCSILVSWLFIFALRWYWLHHLVALFPRRTPA